MNNHSPSSFLVHRFTSANDWSKICEVVDVQKLIFIFLRGLIMLTSKDKLLNYKDTLDKFNEFAFSCT